MGVTVETIRPGDNKTYPKPGDTVTMDYTGKFLDGTVFDSSLRKGRRFTTQIGVGRVIQGWDEGVPQLSLGEEAILRCTSDYAYGPSGAGGVIPPNAVFSMDLGSSGYGCQSWVVVEGTGSMEFSLAR